jgi:hypothetical protein
MLVRKPEYALLRSAIFGITLLIPKIAFKRWGFFNEALSCTQDYAKWREMMADFSFVHMPTILAQYRVHKMQDTNNNPKVASEGDALWIQMIQDISIKRRRELEGTEVRFFEEMILFLQNTPYQKTLTFCVNEKKIKQFLEDIRGKRICIFSHSSALGGAERSLTSIIKAFSSFGLFVHVILPCETGWLAEWLVSENISFSVFQMSQWTNEKFSNNKSFLTKIIAEINALLQDDLLRNADIFYTNTSVIPHGAFVARLLGRLHIWHIHEFGLPEYGVNYLLPEVDLKNFINDFSDRVIFTSYALRESYKKFVPDEKVEVMYNVFEK